MKKYILLVIACLLFVFVAVFFWWQFVTKSPTNDPAKISFTVSKGKGASQIASDLKQSGLIKNALAFKFYVQLTGRAKTINAGEFEVARNLTMFEVLDVLSGGPLELWVTVPEGLRREEVVERFIKGLEISPDRATIFRAEFLSVAEDGYMFPDTYLFPRDASATTVANRMKGLFEEKVKHLKNSINDSNLSLEEIITLASIVERETKTANERPIVAGILLNRLEIGMALQADATTQYAVANVKCKNKLNCDWWVPPTLEDLEINSPYNTYKFPGLPPTPIANPGLSSIEAVVSPTVTDYFYYIHESNGTIHYAKNLAEHNSNIVKYLGR